jgi:hypothetical protein
MLITKEISKNLQVKIFFYKLLVNSSIAHTFTYFSITNCALARKRYTGTVKEPGACVLVIFSVFSNIFMFFWCCGSGSDLILVGWIRIRIQEGKNKNVPLN